jgi:hypothetical protein
MATKSSDSAAHRSDRHGSKVLGRSAATGRYVLKPVPKGGSVTLRDAKRAVAAVAADSKKK